MFVLLFLLTAAAAQDEVLMTAGKALDRLDPASDGERAAIGIVRAALHTPARQIADNAGIDGRWAVARTLEVDDPHHGLNAADGQFSDLVEAGVVDAVEVVSTALRNATSTAARIVTSDAAIAPLEAAPT